MSKARRLLSMFVELDQPAPPPELPARASAPWTMATEASPPSPARNPAELPLSDVYQAAGVSGETAPKVQRILDGLGVLAPVLAAIEPKPVKAREPLTFTAIATDPDPEDTVTYTVEPLPEG